MFRSKSAFIVLFLALCALNWHLAYGLNSAAPKGEWINLQNGGCDRSTLRFRFRDEILIANGADSSPFATDALYSRQKDGALRVSFFMPAKGQSLHMSIDFDATDRLLTPKAVRYGKGEFKTDLSDQFRKGFTFRRCDTEA
jgi:hypothetical protein